MFKLVINIKTILFEGKNHNIYQTIESEKYLNEVFKTYQGNTMVLLETMAGKGSELGTNFQELKRIIDGVTYSNRLGVCLDTCHLNDSGYDLSDFDKKRLPLK